MSLDEPIIIVSGLPRSGTSLMMQVLQAVGVPVMTDSVRPPDLSNPRGYFEYEKRNGWRPTIRGWERHAAKR